MYINNSTTLVTHSTFDRICRIGPDLQSIMTLDQLGTIGSKLDAYGFNRAFRLAHHYLFGSAVNPFL